MGDPFDEKWDREEPTIEHAPDPPRSPSDEEVQAEITRQKYAWGDSLQSRPKNLKAAEQHLYAAQMLGTLLAERQQGREDTERLDVLEAAVSNVERVLHEWEKSGYAGDLREVIDRITARAAEEEDDDDVA